MHKFLSPVSELTATGRWREKIPLCLFIGAVLFFIVCFGTRPITDLDFWWHLKTGELMVQIRGLLQSDPFTFAGDGLVSVRETLILKGYWLWQLIAYGLNALWVFNGIFLFNLLTLGAMVAVVGGQMFRQGVRLAVAAPLMTLGFYLM